MKRVVLMLEQGSAKNKWRIARSHWGSAISWRIYTLAWKVLPDHVEVRKQLYFKSTCCIRVGLVS